MKTNQGFRHALVLLLAAAMMTSLTACGDEPANVDEDTTAADVSEETTEAVDPSAVLEIPNTDWGGREFRVLGRLDGREIFTNFEIDVEAENGEIVNDAIFKRNSIIEERYNVDIVQSLMENNETVLQKAVMTGDALYDASFQTIMNLKSIISSGYLYDMYQLPYVDFTKPWWNETANSVLEIDDRLFCTSSAFSLQEKARIYFGVYNAGIAEQYDVGDIQQMVLDGTWTIDKMNEYGRRFAADVNQDGKMDMDDHYSVVCGAYTNFAAYTVAQDNSIISKDDSGNLIIVMNNEHMIDSIDKTLTLLDRSVSMYCNDFKNKVDFDHWNASSKLFTQGQAMFNLALISSLETLSASEIDYRVIAFPKYDEEQDRYYALAEEHGMLICVPTNAPDPDFTGFMLEALSYESYTTTLPAYIEISAKVKHTYDEKSAQILDLIFNSVQYDFGFLYRIGNLDSILMDSIPAAGENRFTSLYASKEKAALKDLEKFLDLVKQVE